MQRFDMTGFVRPAGRVPRRWHSMVPIVTVALVAICAPLTAQSAATIRGVVQDLATGTPLPGTRVTVVGSDISVVTDEQGIFEIRDLAGTNIVLRIHHDDRARIVESVPIQPGKTTGVVFELPLRAQVLDALKVIGRAPAESRSEVPADDPLRLTGASISNVLDQVSGVQLIRTSGRVGAPFHLRIRGVNSITFSAAPLVYVDGVRTSFPGDAGASGLELINPTTIGRIEVIRGSSASARYGPDATNGVILITTRR